MKTFLTVLKNNYLRTVPRIAAMAVITLVTLATILLAVYMTGLGRIKGRIVLVSDDPEAAEQITSPYLSVKVLSEKPRSSSLLQKKYDAFVTIDAAGEFRIETLKKQEYQQLLLNLLQHSDYKPPLDQKTRGIGANILGFMMMFLLMISISNLFAFADDKEKGQLRRIAAAPVSFTCYLSAQYIYCLSMFLPEYLLLVIIKLCGGNIGFNLGEYALLMGVLALLGISFGLLLHTLIHKPDNANMLGNSVAVLTSILAGSFYSFTRESSLLTHLIKVLPQRQLMDYAQQLENRTAEVHSSSVLYVLMVSLILFGISVISLRRQYVKTV